MSKPKCVIKRPSKKDMMSAGHGVTNTVDLHFNNISIGQVMTLQKVCQEAGGAIGEDLAAFIRNAIVESDSEISKQFG